MSGPPRFPVHVGDYLKDTPPISRATWEHHGIYVLALMIAWNVPGCRLPNDPHWLSLRFGCTIDEYREHVDPVLRMYFTKRGKFLVQKRAANEYQRLVEKRGKSRNSAKSRWDKEKTDANACPDDIQTHASRARPTPTPTPTPTPRKKGSADADSASAVNGHPQPTSGDGAPLLSDPQQAPDDCRQAVEAYNETAARLGWPRAQVLTATRRRHLLARLREAGLDGWKTALAKAAASPFCRGEAPGRWAGKTADFDFLVKAEHFTRLMEGSYDDRRPRSAAPEARADRAEQRRRETLEAVGIDPDRSDAGDR